MGNAAHIGIFHPRHAGEQQQHSAKSSKPAKKITLNTGQLFSIKKVHVLPESLPAALASLEEDNVSDLETLAGCQFRRNHAGLRRDFRTLPERTKVSGEPGLGVTLVTTAVMNALKQAGSNTSYYIADQLVKNRNDRAWFETVVNNGSRIDVVRGVINSSVRS